MAVTLPSAYDTRLWLALLYEIEAAGGQGRPSALYPRMRAYFPQITEADLALKNVHTGENKWRNRIQWARQKLVERGCIDSPQRGIWRLTDRGRQWLLANWRGPTADYSQVRKPKRLTENLAPPGQRRGPLVART